MHSKVAFLPLTTLLATLLVRVLWVLLLRAAQQQHPKNPDKERSEEQSAPGDGKTWRLCTG